MAGFNEILQTQGGYMSTIAEKAPLITAVYNLGYGIGNTTVRTTQQLFDTPLLFAESGTPSAPFIIAKLSLFDSNGDETPYNFRIECYLTSTFAIRGRWYNGDIPYDNYPAHPVGSGSYTKAVGYYYYPSSGLLGFYPIGAWTSDTPRQYYIPSGSLINGVYLKIADAIEAFKTWANLDDDYNFKYELYSDEYGTPSTEGGYTGGTFDDSSDTIALPSIPTFGVTSAGFVNVYNPSAGNLQGLGSELFPDLSFTPDSAISGTGGVTEALEAMANALVNFGNQIPNIVNMYINSNLINYVIDCHIIPVAPATSAAQNIKIGFKNFTPTAPVVTSDYVDFDCGNLQIGEYYANFIDYAPYTKAKLFLPFVGFVDLAPEFFQSGTINVTYRFNIIDGSFMAFVRSTSSKSNLSNSVVMQFGGNACVHIPLTGLNYSSMVSGVVSGAAAVASTQSGVQALGQAVNSAVDVANAKPPMQQSNGYNATTSFLGVRVPYLLIERSVSNFSVSYTDEEGLPSNISTSFSSLSGFTKASSVLLDGITGATSDELAEIGRLLAEGVIL